MNISQPDNDLKSIKQIEKDGDESNQTKSENNKTEIFPEPKNKLPENSNFGKKNKILPIIGMCFGLLVYFASVITIFFLLTGSLFIRTILVLLLIYQYCFAKKSETYRKFLKFFEPWEVFKSYTVYTEEELKKEKSLFSFHPHGVLAFGTSMTGAKNEILYDACFCGSRAMMNLPLSGIIARWIGVVGVNNKNFKDIMKKGKNIIFMPGGFEEATITSYSKDKVYIKNRKGFIKYALEYGYRVYPSYTFNENRIFYTITAFEKFRLFLNKFKIPGTFFFSKYFIFPNTDLDLFTVVGKPIEFPIISDPTKEEIDRYHKLYIQELVNLYNRHKNKYHASEQLEIY